LETQKGHKFGGGFAILEERFVDVFSLGFLELLFIRALANKTIIDMVGCGGDRLIREKKVLTLVFLYNTY
jgi:hypothetical protein